MRQAMSSGKAEDERWHLRKDGTQFWATGALTCIRDEEGQILGFSKLFRDDTARKHTIESIHIKNADLNRFAYTAAHDLQQPIRTVTNYIQLTLRQRTAQLDPQTKEYLQIVLDAAERMRRLTDDLLAYAQSEKKHDMDELVDCNGAFDIAAENLKFAIDESRAFIHRGALPEIKGIPTQICQVFQNLVGNAIKFRHPTRTPIIIVDATKLHHSWQFTVADNGLGIEAKDQARVFAAFERGDDSGHGGSGLGLSITKRIIEAHGGKIWIEASTPEGTVIKFTIPACNQSSPLP
jgi:signal transduction histidine kinase